MTKRKLYCVWWADTFGQLRWRDEHEIEEMALENKEYIKTVGYYVGTFGDFTCIAAAHNTNKLMSEWGSITLIPTGCIKTIKKL